MQFSVPRDFHPGALDRHLPLGKLPGVPVFGDVYRVLPESEWLEAIRDPNRPQMSKQVWSINDQDGNGSCASEAAHGGCKLVRALSGREKVETNPLGTYGRVNGGSDRGSSLSANIAHVTKHGCFPESVWPRSKGWRAEPTEAAYEAASHYKLHESYDCDDSSSSQFFAELFSAVLMGPFPTEFGYPGHAILAVEILESEKAPPEAIKCADAVDRWILKKGYTMGDNPTGLVNDLLVMYLNSWHESWGWNGFGYLRASRIQRSYGAFPMRAMVEA